MDQIFSVQFLAASARSYLAPTGSEHSADTQTDLLSIPVARLLRAKISNFSGSLTERAIQKILEDPAFDLELIIKDASALLSAYERVLNKFGESAALSFASFAASGLNREQMLNAAREIDKLFNIVQVRMKKKLLESADSSRTKVEEVNMIFGVLASIKQDRYVFDYFPLHLSLAAYNNGDPATKVGNCLNLAIIDNIILSRFGFDVFAATNEAVSFGGIHHIHSRIKIEGRVFDLDNIYNFSRMSPPSPEFEGISNIELVAMIYEKRGREAMSAGDLEAAKIFFTECLRLYPRSTSVLESRSYVNIILGEHEAAVEDCTRALEINPKRYIALNNRGAARHRIALKMIEDGMLDKAKELLFLALEDFNAALELNPAYENASFNKIASTGLLEEIIK